MKLDESSNQETAIRLAGGQGAGHHPLNQALADASLVACPNCDLLQKLPDLVPGQSARCPRCDSELWRRRRDSLNRSLALTIAAAVLFIITNTMPMLGLSAVGHESFTTVFGGAELLWEHGMPVVSILVFLSVIVAPALQIVFLLLVLLGAQCKLPPAWVGTLLRHLPSTRLWSMLEVMLLGVLVALTKIAEYATVIPGHAIFAVGGLVILFAAIQSIFDPREVWQRVEWAEARKQNTAAGAAMKEAAA